VCAGAPLRTTETVETKFGITTVDPYRWMEGNDNAELTTWLRSQGECARRHLGHLPQREPLFKRLRELGLGTTAKGDMTLAGGRAFFTETAAGEQLPKLVVRDANGKERVLVDPQKLGSGDGHASINAFSPSPDGKRIAYDLAVGGGEVSAIHVMDVEKGADLPDVIDHVWGQFAASWMPDGRSFFYTQMAPAAPGTDPLQNMQARYHVLGQPTSKDVALIGNGAPSSLPMRPEEFPHIGVTPDGKWVIAAFAGAHEERRVSVAPVAAVDLSGNGKTPWRVVAEYADQVTYPVVHGDRLYLRTFKGAPNRKIISVPLAHPSLTDARVEMPESPDAVISAIADARDGLYVETMVNGRAALWRMPWKGAAKQVPLPFEGWVDDIATDPLRDGARFGIEGWTRPSAYFDVNAAGATSATGIATTSIADYSSVAVDEVEARSADGTMVPFTIVRPKDLPLDGTRPAIVYGYGGYGTSITPSFSTNRLPWIEAGGTYAFCHVRGGGEKGRRWQDDGSHERKMNGIHDLEGCAQYLIDHKITSASHLAARGGSAGGILIGRAVTDRPDLFAAANISVGLVNTTRLLAAENGANQKFELGDPETESGFKALYEMDAFQHVAASAAYPAVLFTVGLNDKRVAPWMSGKMAARMQVASTSGRPVLVRTEDDAGHGIGSMRDQVYAELADVYAFFIAASSP
jgi:prolyl oligopeptidase